MDIEKREVRFMIDEDIYEEMKEEAKKLGVPLASYAKMKVGEGRVHGRRREENK